MLDLRLPGLDVPAMLTSLRDGGRDLLPLPVVTVIDSSQDAVESLRAGAHDCLERQLDQADLQRALVGARTTWRLQDHLQRQRRLTEEQTHRFDQLADHAPVMLWRADDRGRRFWFNRLWRTFTGLTEHRARGEAWTLAIHEADRDGVLAAIRAMVERGSEYRCEYRLRSAEGDHRWVLDLARRDDDGDYIGCSIDIHDRKQAEAALSQREHEFHATIAHAGVGLALLDLRDLTLHGPNRYLARMLHVSEDRIAGTGLADWIDPDHRRRLDEAGRFLDRSEGEKAIRLDDLPLVTSRGHHVWVELMISPVVGRGGSSRRAVLVASNITLHRRREHDLAERNRELSTIAAASGHDLKAPLRTITGYLDLLREPAITGLDPAGRALLDKALRGVDRMRGMVEGLVAYLSTEEVMGRCEVVDLGACWQEARDNLAAEIAASGCRIVCDPLPEAAADPGLMAQVFQNLVGNALKFVPRPGGEIRITATYAPDEDEWTVRVHDNGPGIDPAQRERVFRLFQSGRPDGSGVGLALCRRVVQSCGGDIWIEDGPGTTVAFCLPARPIEEDSGPQDID